MTARVEAKRIVVGVDASDGSREALRWAIDQSRPGDTIELVHTWNVHVMGGIDTPPLDPAPYAAGADRLLRDTADEVFEDEERELVDVVFSPIHGHAAGALIDASDGADLLVVGRRGLGGFKALLLGSVSGDVVHHARCPVVVIPIDWSATHQQRNATTKGDGA